jgi:dolichol-phosphate mannosyltransferase
MSSNKLISIVVPVYNEEKNIDPLYGELMKVFSSLAEYDFEIILVNDGSKDGSIGKLEELSQKDNRVKVLDFSRNFGKEVATSAGCHNAKGDAVITMDADLQHPPELIRELLKKWQEGFEVVYTVRKENKGASFVKKTTSDIYWWLFNKVSSVDSEPHSTDFRLMDKKVIDAFKDFPEKERLFRGLIDWMGYKRTRVEFVASERNSGIASYSYVKLIRLAINSFTAFSLMPLRLAGYFGIVITSLSFMMLIVMVAVEFLFKWDTFTPLAFVMVANTFLIGIVLSCLGFVALYIARIHDEVIGRPLYIIRKKTNIDE